MAKLLVESGQSQILGRRATAASPIPTENLARWYKADALQLANDALVASWTDSSVNAQHATQTGADSLKPTYKTNRISGKPSVYFDGGNYLISPVVASDPAALTVFACVAIADLDSPRGVWAHRSESTRLIQLARGTSSGFKLQLRGSSVALQELEIAPATTNAVILTARFNKPGKSHQLWRNGGDMRQNTTDFGADTFTSTQETIGAVYSGSSYGQQMLGDIAEVIIYSAALSNTDANTVGAYLGTKYGITWTNIT